MITKILFFLMKRIPCFELVLRRIIYLKKDDGRPLKTVKKSSKLKCLLNKNEIDKFWAEISKLGISNGDILIVHSSMSSLKKLGLSPSQIIDKLQSMVGRGGTLVFPAFPDYTATNNIFDKSNPLCWTGIIPTTFCKMEGVIRSSFPINPLAARGKEASLMMNNVNQKYGHDKFSPWYYCTTHKAKILFLGCEIPRSNTIIHIVEDCNADKWPIDNWYTKKTYLIKENDVEIKKDVLERRTVWSKYINEYRNTERLKRHHLLTEQKVSGIKIGFISDSSEVITFLDNRLSKNKLEYVIPKKYWKKKDKLKI